MHVRAQIPSPFSARMLAGLCVSAEVFLQLHIEQHIKLGAALCPSLLSRPLCKSSLEVYWEGHDVLLHLTHALLQMLAASGGSPQLQVPCLRPTGSCLCAEDVISAGGCAAAYCLQIEVNEPRQPTLSHSDTLLS